MSSEIIQLEDRRQINWITGIVLAIFHAGALAAPFYFEWRSVIVAFVLYWIAVGWGISLGYHRLHTHRGYKCPLWMEYFFALCGTLTLEGGPIFWVATHRIH
ncbi:MAG: acyl-CoA desaturase, partial [Bryobacterales bacterium]|nr:acyl-CoA desaturase [Bryobacterales bacterium]